MASAHQVSLVGWLSFKGSSSFSMLCRFGIEYMRTVQLTDDFLASSVSLAMSILLNWVVFGDWNWCW